MGFAILRTQKLKHLASARRSLKHAFRDQDTPNANPELTPSNTHIGASSVDEGMAKLEALLPPNRRSDAVLAIEYLVSASPEDLQGKTRAQQDAYLLDALKWIQDRHGAGNVVYAGIHRDETTPHLYAYAVPLDADTGRLNAKKWLGGAKALNQMQTEFAAKVGAQHGLQRGVERSKATHTTIREHYAQIKAGQQQAAQEATITADDLKPVKSRSAGLLGALRLSSEVETPEGVAERLTGRVKAVAVASVAAQQETKKLKAENAQLRKEVSSLSKAAGNWMELVNNLAKSQLEKLFELARGFHRENQEATRAQEKRWAEQERERREQVVKARSTKDRSR